MLFILQAGGARGIGQVATRNLRAKVLSGFSLWLQDNTSPCQTIDKLPKSIRLAKQSPHASSHPPARLILKEDIEIDR